MNSRKKLHPDYIYLIVCFGLIGVGGIIFSVSEVTLDILNKIAGILSFFITSLAAIFAYVTIYQWKAARDYDSRQEHNKAFAHAKLSVKSKLRILYAKSNQIFNDKYDEDSSDEIGFNTYKALCLSKVSKIYKETLSEITEDFYKLNYTEYSLLETPDTEWMRNDKSNMFINGTKEIIRFEVEFMRAGTSDDCLRQVRESINNMLVLIDKIYVNPLTANCKIR